MTDDAFPDAAAWPEPEARDPRYDNQPPLEERVVMEFDDVLTRERLNARIHELTASAARVPETIDATVAGGIGDLLKQARAARVRVEEIREGQNRPILNAQRALKGRADAVLAPMDEAMNSVKRRLDSYMAEERRKADEARRAAEAEARRLQEEAAREAKRREEEAAAAGREVEPAAPPPVIAPAKVEAPVVRGDYGSRVGTKVVWKHRIESVRKLPDHLLKHEKVVEALDKVIAAQIRGGAREIKGVEIWQEHEASVR